VADEQTKKLLAANREKGVETRRLDRAAALEAGSKSRGPRKRRAAQAVAEAAKAKQNEIAEVFLESIQDDQPMRIRLEGAEKILKVEREEDRLQMQEDAYASMTREEIANVALQKILESPLADLLKEKLLAEQPAIDGTAVEIDE